MTTRAAILRTKWFLPLLLGRARPRDASSAFWIGGNPRPAGSLARASWPAAGASIFLLGGRIELVRGLRGDGRDEYWPSIDLGATALAGSRADRCAVITMCVWEWAHGRDGSPYAQLGAIAGVAYIAAVGILRWRV